MNITVGVDQNVETELAEADQAAADLMKRTVEAYQRASELRVIRDMRKAQGAKIQPHAERNVLPLTSLKVERNG